MTKLFSIFFRFRSDPVRYLSIFPTSGLCPQCPCCDHDRRVSILWISLKHFTVYIRL